MEAAGSTPTYEQRELGAHPGGNKAALHTASPGEGRKGDSLLWEREHRSKWGLHSQ